MSSTSSARTVFTLAAACLLAGILAACGGSLAPDSGHTPKPQGSMAHSAPATKAAGAPTEHVGGGFAVTSSSGSKYDVHLTKVIDPAQGTDEFSTPDAGKRLVGAVFRITGVKGNSSDDANNDATLIGSNGQAYQADFDSIAGYTNFSSGQFNAAPGAAEVGAVTFQVPAGVKVAEVQWSADSGFGGAPGIWKVSK